VDRIQAIKQEISALGTMRKGSLSKQKRAWGKSYWHLSYYHRGKGHTAYICEEDIERVREELENYRRFQELCRMLIDYSLEAACLPGRQLNRVESRL
jgi:pyruvate/2-oxoacid:ferredoxin oxidoreductase beta subunit